MIGSEADAIVGAVRRYIAERVVPAVTEPDVARSLAIALQGLDEHLHRASDEPGRQDRARRTAAFFDRARAILGNPAGGANAELISTLVQRAERDEAAAALLVEAAAIDIDAARRLPATSLPATQRTQERLAGMGDYFAARRVIAGGTAVRAVRKLSGGFSRETFLVDVGGEGGGDRLVVRQAKTPGLLDGLGVKLTQEEPFIRLAGGAGVPVAEPFWTETNPAVLGEPFLVTSFAAGRNLGDTLQATETVPHAVIRDLAHVLARLHAMPWRAAVAEMEAPWSDFAAMDGPKTTRALLKRIETYVESMELALSPAAQALSSWLWRNVPEDGLPPAITHGDIGFHNLLIEGERISAILDWESVVPCSPAKDLANVRSSMTAHVAWSQFLEWYREAGGVVPTESELQYQSRLRMLLGTVVCRAAVDVMFARTAEPDPEFLALGQPGLAFFGQAIADAFAEDKRAAACPVRV